MGCDIHLHIEVRVNGKWEHYSNPSISRWYDMFAIMANVRNNSGIKPISNPKGLLEDCNLITNIACIDFGSDGHSHSYLSAEEIITLDNWVFGNGGDWPDNDLEYKILHTYLEGNSFSGFSKLRGKISIEFSRQKWFSNELIHAGPKDLILDIT